MTWRERVIKARRREGEFSLAAHRLVRSWQTCAVGEQAEQHPRVVLMDGIWRPQDDALMTLGLDFFRAVDAEDAIEAERLLDQIEDRVLELKREQKGEANGEVPERGDRPG
jgi:hypothetical protein